MTKFVALILSFFLWQTANASDASPPKTLPQKDYFENLFTEVEAAKKSPPDIASKKLYDKVAKDSVAYGVLKEFPNLRVGPLAFRPLSKTAPHAAEIKQGEEMISKEFQSDKPLRYKDAADLIDRKIADPNSPLKDRDWILMANAFRMLKAPDAPSNAPEESHHSHLLGVFLAEYILLGEIKKQENNPHLDSDSRLSLSTLYYDLSQLYKSMYKNDEDLFKKSKKGRLTLEIPPVYRGNESSDNFPAAYDAGYDAPYDALVGRHLDLLGNSLLFDPYDDLGWGQLIDFAAFDLIDPGFYDEFSPDFWGSYFPHGFRREDAGRLRDKWGRIEGNMKNYRTLRENRADMNEALARLSRNAAPSSLLNKTIARETHDASSAEKMERRRSNAARSQTRGALGHFSPKVFRALTENRREAAVSHAARGSGGSHPSGHGGDGRSGGGGSHGDHGGGHGGGGQKKRP